MEISKEEHLKRQRSSGLRIKEYAERSAIPASRIYGWMKDVRRKKVSNGHGRTFVRVSPEAAPIVEVRLQNGIVLKVSSTMEAGALQRLVEALNACAE